MALPGMAELYLPMLIATTGMHWEGAPMPWVMAAQIEKETCITLHHSRCWSPRAELKTSRENGIGFGQVTRAYKADGSLRFDKQAELRRAHPELREWTWARRYDPKLQMAGLVLMDAKAWKRFRDLTDNDWDAWRFTLSGYNGGDGAVLKARLTCRGVAGCDPQRWYGNVELHLNKSRVKWRGYGQSAYDINTGYVRQIERRAGFYKPYWESHERSTKQE